MISVTPGFRFLIGVQVERLPIGGVHGRIGDHDGIQEHILVGKDRRKFFRRAGSDEREEGQFVFVSDFDVHGEEIGAREKCPHVAVEVGGMNSHGDGVIDLGANFAFGFVGFQRGHGLRRIGPEISGGIEEAGNFVFGCDRAPAVGFPFAGESEVQAEIGVGMGFGVVGDFGEPGAGNHDAGGGDGVLVEGVETGGVFRVSDGEVVGVEDEEFRVGGVAETFGDGFGLGD